MQIQLPGALALQNPVPQPCGVDQKDSKGIKRRHILGSLVSRLWRLTLPECLVPTHVTHASAIGHLDVQRIN